MARITISSATPSQGLSIGQISRQAGCGIETVRYYERIGLLPRPPRTAGGHRVYDAEHLRRLAFIRRSRDLGFTLAEVQSLLRLVEGHRYSCAQIRSLTATHLDQIRGKLADMRRLERTLAAYIARCTGGSAPDCPIVDALQQDGRPQ